MNYIAMHQWLDGIRARLIEKGAGSVYATLQLTAYGSMSLHWKMTIMVDSKDPWSEDNLATPEDALLVANKYVANWLHPDKRLALVLGIDTEPKPMVDDVGIKIIDAAPTNVDDLIPF